MCLSAAAELAGISYAVVQKRIHGPLKWDVDAALDTPVKFKAKKGERIRATPMSNKTGFKGVKRRREGFIARILVNGKRVYSRQFATPEEARAWYVSEHNKKCRN